jgi:hypothetical protein
MSDLPIEFGQDYPQPTDAEINAAWGRGPTGPAAEPTLLDKLRDALVDTNGLDTIPEPEPLIAGVLHRNSVAWLQGKPGDGKSFVALDMAGCIATGETWQAHQVTQGPVLYVAAEGATGIRWRVRAWEKAMGRPMTGVQWLPQAVQASRERGEWRHLIALAVDLKPVLIVLDTQARVTVGMEENAAKDMGVFVDQLEQLRIATGACIVPVHHQGRNGDHMRGSTALDGAADTVLQVVKDESLITVTCRKQKNADPFEEIYLDLVPMDNSAVLVRGDGETSRTGRSSAALKMAAKWWGLFRDDKVSASKLIDAGIGGSKASFYRNVRELQDSATVASEAVSRNKYYWLTRDPG